MKSVVKFVALADKVKAIVESDISWNCKYNIIFSNEVSKEIGATGIDLEYCDPDTTCEEDVMAYANAVFAKAEELRPLSEKFSSEEEGFVDSHILLKRGGPWLGAARSYLQWHVPNGDHLTWGSDDKVTMTVRQVEELAAKVAETLINKGRCI